MNQKKLKKIRRFGKLRFAGHSNYREDVLIDIYEKADGRKRLELDEEMDSYFEALNEHKIKAGESILNAILAEDSIKPMKD